MCADNALYGAVVLTRAQCLAVVTFYIENRSFRQKLLARSVFDTDFVYGGHIGGRTKLSALCYLQFNSPYIITLLKPLYPDQLWPRESRIRENPVARNSKKGDRISEIQYNKYLKNAKLLITIYVCRVYSFFKTYRVQYALHYNTRFSIF